MKDTEKEDNRLIFDFLGCIHSSDPALDNYEMNNLKYHKDWNTLMPVVGKCRQAFSDIQSESVDPQQEGMDILDALFDALSWARIDRAHKTVVDFIKWYNSVTPPLVQNR